MLLSVCGTRLATPARHRSLAPHRRRRLSPRRKAQSFLSSPGKSYLIEAVLEQRQLGSRLSAYTVQGEHCLFMGWSRPVASFSDKVWTHVSGLPRSSHDGKLYAIKFIRPEQLGPHPQPRGRTRTSPGNSSSSPSLPFSLLCRFAAGVAVWGTTMGSPLRVSSGPTRMKQAMDTRCRGVAALPQKIVEP